LGFLIFGKRQLNITGEYVVNEVKKEVLAFFNEGSMQFGGLDRQFRGSISGIRRHGDLLVVSFEKMETLIGHNWQSITPFDFEVVLSYCITSYEMDCGLVRALNIEMLGRTRQTASIFPTIPFAISTIAA